MLGQDYCLNSGQERNEELGRHRGREGRKECLLCDAECESVSHVLWDCPAYVSIRSAFTLELRRELGDRFEHFQSLDSFEKSSSYVLGSEAWDSGLLKDFVLSVWEERKVRLYGEHIHQSHSQNDSGDLRGVARGDGELGCLCGKAGTSHLCDGSAHSSGCEVNGYDCRLSYCHTYIHTYSLTHSYHTVEPNVHFQQRLVLPSQHKVTREGVDLQLLFHGRSRQLQLCQTKVAACVWVYIPPAREMVCVCVCMCVCVRRPHTHYQLPVVSTTRPSLCTLSKSQPTFLQWYGGLGEHTDRRVMCI